MQSCTVSRPTPSAIHRLAVGTSPPSGPAARSSARESESVALLRKVLICVVEQYVEFRAASAVMQETASDGDAWTGSDCVAVRLARRRDY